MKTRAEMIYDFMVSLSGNAVIYSQWERINGLGSYATHIRGLAEEMADEYLRNLA